MNTSIQPKIDSIEIVYEDDYIVAANKPNNFLIHESHYARNINEPTLLETLNNQLGYSSFPIHRLDRKTSGIILFAKEKKFIKEFQGLFQSQNIQKAYYAVVRGFADNKGLMDSPIQNDDTGVYKEALTRYETVQTIELDLPVHPYEKSRYSLVKLLPRTGRMHQLRKHLNKISHPIVGDYKYGDRFHNRNFENNFNWIYMFLHAYSIELTHPFTKKKMSLKADFPSDWKDLFQNFNWSI